MNYPELLYKKIYIEKDKDYQHEIKNLQHTKTGQLIYQKRMIKFYFREITKKFKNDLLSKNVLHGGQKNRV